MDPTQMANAYLAETGDLFGASQIAAAPEPPSLSAISGDYTSNPVFQFTEPSNGQYAEQQAVAGIPFAGTMAVTSMAPAPATIAAGPNWLVIILVAAGVYLIARRKK